MYIRKYRILTVITLGLFCQSVVAEDIIFSAPPRETLHQANTLYKPLAKVFSEILGRPVRYIYPDNWLTYQRSMRKDQYDIVFDGPQFSSWRIKHLKHKLLVKLSGTIGFVTLVHKQNTTITKMEDLIGKKICAISPPNLTALTTLEYYKNPMQQPILHGVRGGMKKVLSLFYKGVCDAAVIRSSYYEKKLSSDIRNKVKIIYRSVPLPNQAFTVSNKLSAADIKKLSREIEFGKIKELIYPIAKRFGGKDSEFLSAKTSEYRNQRLLLEGVILGW